MFRQVLFVQWKWARIELLGYALAAFLIPTVMIRVGIAAATNAYSVVSVLGGAEAAGVFYVALAFICAMSLATRPWLADASLKHMYALSLPIRWSTFIRLRFLAGALLLLIPAVATWLGGLLASAAVSIPPTLHTYPAGMALRFAMTSLLLYAACFLLQYTAGRNAARVAAGALLALAVLELAGRALGMGSMSIALWHFATTAPGPFETLTARWLLIDV